MSPDIFANHTIVLRRPVYDTARAWYQAECTCGWHGHPTYTTPHQRLAAQNHLDRIRDAAAWTSLDQAAEAGGRFDYAAWKLAHPIPPLTF